MQPPGFRATLNWPNKLTLVRRLHCHWPDEVQASQKEGQEAVGEGDEAELFSAEGQHDQDAEEGPEHEGRQRDGEGHQHELAERVLGRDQKPDLSGQTTLHSGPRVRVSAVTMEARI